MGRNRKTKKQYVKPNTFTKIWVNRCMWFSWICIFWCFILATMGKDQVAENLATALVINIVGVILGYLAKSFFETREEKNLEYKRELDKYNNETMNNGNYLDDDSYKGGK